MNNKKIIAGAIGGLWVTAFLTDVVQAQTCINPPSCDALGYKQKESECSGQHMLRCPLDMTAVFCGGTACSYTNLSKPVGCSLADNCENGGKTYYGDICFKCYEGYDLNSNGKCQQVCDYSATSTSHCSSYDSCVLESASEKQEYYYCNSCDSGYFQSGGSCYSCLNGNSCTGPVSASPYSEEECRDILHEEDVNVYSFSCGGKTYYYCREGADLPCLM